MAEIWGIAAAAVVAGGAIVSSSISANASKNAAQASANAAQQGADDQMAMFNTTQANFAPQVALGQGAANMLSGIYGSGTPGQPGYKAPTTDYSQFFNTPGYQFSLQQGQSAINKQAAASGGLYSSNTLAAQGNYVQGQASTQYNSYINQLLSMAGLGNAAASGVGTAATATGQGLANSAMNAGNAQASGILGQSNAFSNGLGSVSNQLGNYFNNQPPSLIPLTQNGGQGGGIGNIVDNL